MGDMKFEAIFWDADGVVLKRSRLFSEQLALDFGIDIEQLRPFFTGVLKQCAIGKADLKEELAKVIGEWGWKGTVEELVNYWFTKGTELDPDVAALITALRQQGVHCVMTTNNEKYRGAHLAATLGDGKVLDGVFYSGALGVSKKDPAFFTHVYQALNAQKPLEKSAVLCIDNDEGVVEMAKSLGFSTHLYTGLESLKQFLAE